MTAPGERRPVRALLALLTVLATTPVSASLIRLDSPAGGEGLVLRAEDSGGVRIDYGLASFRMDPLKVQGSEMQIITLPGAMIPNNAGAPNLPGQGCFIAIPRGATATLTVLSAQTQVYRDIDVAPAPPLPIDGDDAPLVYEMDSAIYSQDAFFPASPAVLSATRALRGVDVVLLGITPFQYNPVKRELLVYSSLEVRIDFEGGTGTFGDPRLRSRHWEPLLRDHLVNYAALPEQPALKRTEGLDPEYVILCPDHPDFIAWADTLKNWRTLQGISTEVFTLTDIGGSDAATIEAWLNNAYLTWDPAPAAFLILGDYVTPGGLGVTAPVYNGYCISDNIYADVDGDHLPDMAHGRICARDSLELATMIGKMLAYERQPVADSSFYQHPVFAGGWQTERWFILCCEVLFGHQVNALGKDPLREYAIYSGSPSGLWSTNVNTPTVVDYFGPTGLGYIPDTPNHLVDWGGTAARINADLNAGAYLLMHRDHGVVQGWGEPRYRVEDLDGLTTDLHPFVFSMNCETGRFNAIIESFAEKFHRLPHGALGMIAATENSFSFVNDTYTWGIFDALWPDFDPGYGAAAEPPLRTAFAGVSGKYYLEASSWPYNPYDKQVTYHLFHHHGDAFMTLYSEVPDTLAVMHDDVCFLAAPDFSVQADSGAVVALTVAGEIIGVAEATGLPQAIPIVVQTEPGLVRITVTKANYRRYDVTVPIIADLPELLLAGSLIRDFAAVDSLGDCDGNADGGADAGEAIELVISLLNAGYDPATSVTATISSSDPYIEILDGIESFEDLEVDSVRACLDDYELTIDPACPDGHLAVLDVLIESIESSWAHSCTLAVEAPVFDLLGYTIDDTAGGNGNGRCDPGDTLLIAPRILNAGSETATSVDIRLHVHHPQVTILVSQQVIDSLFAGTEQVLSFEIVVDSGAVEPDLYLAELVISADWKQNIHPDFEIPVGGFYDDIENGSGEWQSLVVTPEYVSQWHVTDQHNHTADGTWSWKFGDAGLGPYSDLSDGALVSEPIALSDDCELRFWHRIEAEVDPLHPEWCFDGGMIEMSIDGGNWAQAVPADDYPFQVTIDDGLGPWPEGTPVFSGTSDWRQEVIELDGFAGHVQFRFRFGSDGSDGLEGWYIDDVEFVGHPSDPSGMEDPQPLVLHPALLQNQPNPFGRNTTITYRLPGRGNVRLQIFDPTGRLVKTLIDGLSEPGQHALFWDGRNERGETVASGVYFYRFDAEGAGGTRRMVLSR